MPPMTTRSRQLGFWLLMLVLTTLNLRPFITSVGPLAAVIQNQSQIELATLAWLTSLPMILMGLGTWLTPRLMQKIGVPPTMLLALVLIGLGCGLRLWAQQVPLFIFTSLLAGSGAALIQGVLPVLIKWKTPHLVPHMMGIYSASLMGGGALGAQVSAMAYQWGASWQASLALWLWPVIPALYLAHWQLKQLKLPSTTQTHSAVISSRFGLLARRRTWLLMLFFGLMNGGYASTVAWLAPYYQDFGLDAGQSAWLIVVLSVAQAATAFSLPILIRHQSDRRAWLAATVGCQLIGFVGLAYFPMLSPKLLAIILGAGLGGCFSLIMLIALDHLTDAFQAGTLSAFMQSGGFILAAIAPWISALLNQASGNFQLAWQLHGIEAGILLLFTFYFAPRHYAKAMGVSQVR